MKKQSTNKKIYNFKITAILFAVALLCFIIAGSVSLAKYIIQKRNEGYVESPEFYFSSNILGEGSGKTYSLSMGTTSIEFDIYNTEDELRLSGLDIDYVIEVTGGASVNKTSGTLAKDVLSSETIELSGMIDGGTYEVIVTGEAGYELVLKAKFIVGVEKKGFYMSVDNDDEAFVLLTVWSENITGPVDITIPYGLIPDNTNEVMKNVKNYNKETLKYESVSFEDSLNFNEAYASHTYRFFTTSDYDDGEFIVMINENIEASNGILE